MDGQPRDGSAILLDFEHQIACKGQRLVVPIYRAAGLRIIQIILDFASEAAKSNG